MSTPEPLPPLYIPAEHEARIRGRWDAARAFAADPSRVLRGKAEPYCVLIPPPNVTAALHLGHALNNTLQDILVRAHRMKGFETLWMAGTDHAGIATQAVVEKRVLKEEGKRRQDFSREDFVAKIQAFKDEYEATITNQLKLMGCSCDWDRQRFTMDTQCASAVYEAFFRLFKDGLIYRGKRLVNWDPVLQTAVADDECYDEEIDGNFYYLRYPLVHVPEGSDAVPVSWGELRRRGWALPEDAAHENETPAWVTVATTRPETYLGDTAVAINPHDPRAKALRGLHVELPLIGRVIPIIEDSYVVLPERFARSDEEKADPKAKMATGFLKVTPAHDPNDEQIGKRHNLRAINIFAPDATISDKHGWSDASELKGAQNFLGKKREEARKLVVMEFKARGWHEGTKPYRHSVKHSDRSKAIIEPYLSDQWYVKVTHPRLAQAANAALADHISNGIRVGQASQMVGRASPPAEPSEALEATPVAGNTISFHPDRYAKTFEQWHDGIRDWCISRQLWWGHQVPVWSKPHPVKSEPPFSFSEIKSKIEPWGKSGRLYWSPPPLGVIESQSDHICLRNPDDAEVIQFIEDKGFIRDPDVLDTWFSSALWPLSTMGWPGDTELLRAFNPSSTLCTAREIITLWVSRMVMFNRYLMPEGWGGRGGATRSVGVPEQLPSGRGNGPVPFRDVVIHAVIQDGEGRKMSKSLGNGIDPLDIIATHGSDAMRFILAQMATQTQDVRLPVEKDPTGRNTSSKFDLGKRLCNKLWNASRLALSKLPRDGQDANPPHPVHARDLSLVDRWMLARVVATTQAVDAALANYEFAQYATAVYDLLWRDFCDWYLEAIKPTIDNNPQQQAVLTHALEVILRLAHPAMPYVTEAIWEQARQVRVAPIVGLHLPPARRDDLLCLAGWPEIDLHLRDAQAEGAFERLRQVVEAVREVRAAQQVHPKRKITLHTSPALVAEFHTAGALVPTLAGLGAVIGITDLVSFVAPHGSLKIRLLGEDAWLSDLADAVDAKAADAMTAKRIADLEKQHDTITARLNNPGYAQRAPAKLVEESKAQLQAIKAELAVLRG